MNIASLKQSKFLTKADVGTGVLATIKEVYQDNTALEGAPEDLKWIISFNELEKPMVLNSTNGQLIAQITGSDESDNWYGHKVVLYEDPSISFRGKVVGGIRVRAPRNTPKPAQAGPVKTSPRPGSAPIQAAPRPAPAPAPVDPGPDPNDDPDNVPF